MHKLSTHTIYSGEDFENRYAINNIPKNHSVVAKLMSGTDVEYEKELEQEDGKIFCLEIPKSITETVDKGDYTLRLFIEGKKTRAIAEGTLTIA